MALVNLEFKDTADKIEPYLGETLLPVLERLGPTILEWLTDVTKDISKIKLLFFKYIKIIYFIHQLI